MKTDRRLLARLVETFLVLGFLSGIVVAASCRKSIDQREARAIADKAVAAYAKRANLNPSDFALDDFDDSGKVVDWFYSFRSNTDPMHLVSVLVGRHGESEVHRLVDTKDGNVR